MFSFIYKAIGVIFACVLALALPFVFSALVFFVRSLVRGERLPKRRYPSTWVQHSLLRRLLLDFPAAFVHDLMHSNPDAFPMDKCGLVIFEGEQGSGKTVSAVWYMDMLRKKYPKLSIMSNVCLSFADSRLDEWDDIVFKSNGEYGQVVFLDEIQNYFNSLDSKNFPPEMIQEICQQRKQRKTIIGTVQVFNRVAKPIREQTRYIVKPRTLLGCLTVMSIWKPHFYDNAQVDKAYRIKTHLFVHTPHIRSAYDTFETVKLHALHGFKPRSEMLLNDKSEMRSDERRGLFKPRKFG